MTTTNINSQITKSCFSLKLNTGITFCRSEVINNASFKAVNFITFCPGITYNILLPKKYILDMGLLWYGYGGAVFTNIGGDLFGFGAKFHTLSGQAIFQKQLLSKKGKLMLGLGIIFIKQGYSGQSYADTFKTIILKSNPGSKILGTVNCKYFINIKKRVISFDLIYTKGFNTLMDIYAINHLDHSENHYKNLGSGIHFGISFYFGKHYKELR